MPPRDPTLYRLYEIILVYGYGIKSVIHEKFGDGMCVPRFPALDSSSPGEGADASPRCRGAPLLVTRHR